MASIGSIKNARRFGAVLRWRVDFLFTQQHEPREICVPYSWLETVFSSLFVGPNAEG